MDKWIMLEIAVHVDTEKDNVNEIVDELNITIDGGASSVNVKEYNVENSYEFEL